MTYLYDADFLLWTEKQADFLRQSQWNNLDIEHLAEEIEAIGRSELNKARSLLKQIFIHRSKLEFIPDKYNRNHWQHELNEFSDQLEDTLTPSMRLKLELEINKIWQRARRDVLTDYDIELPKKCPYIDILEVQ